MSLRCSVPQWKWIEERLSERHKPSERHKELAIECYQQKHCPLAEWHTISSSPDTDPSLFVPRGQTSSNRGERRGRRGDGGFLLRLAIGGSEGFSEPVLQLISLVNEFEFLNISRSASNWKSRKGGRGGRCGYHLPITWNNWCSLSVSADRKLIIIH